MWMFYVAGIVKALGIQGEQDRKSPWPHEDDLSQEPDIKQIITEVHLIVVLDWYYLILLILGPTFSSSGWKLTDDN